MSIMLPIITTITITDLSRVQMNSTMIAKPWAISTRKETCSSRWQQCKKANEAICEYKNSECYENYS